MGHDAATASTSQSQQGQERQSREQSQAGQDNRLARLDLSSGFMSPFTLLHRFFSDDVGSLFEQFGGVAAG